MEQETSIPRTGRIEDAATQPHPQIKFTFKGQTPSTTQSSSSPVKAVPLAQDSISASTTLNNADLSKSNGSTSSLSTTPTQPVQMQENKEDVAMKDSQADEVDGKTETNGTGSSQVGITKDTNGSSEAAGEGKASAADASSRSLPPSFPPPSDSANPDSPLFSPMIKSENPSRAQSPTPRESTPALSEAPSDTPSVDSNFAGPPPETSAHDLAHPLSAYQFANTTLVPVASTSTNPFQFVSWPPQPLEDSWQRTRLPDDDEAYLAHDSEAGYSATPEEIAASKLREEARQAKIKAKLSAQVKGKGKAKETVSRPAPKARAMERVASTDATLPPKRPRPQKTPLQQEVQPEPEINRPRPIVSKTRFNRELAMALLPDDVQTATPAGIVPHKDFIDLWALPSHYITEEGIPPPKSSAPPSSRGQRASVSKPQSPAVPAVPVAPSRPATATATPTPVEVNPPATKDLVEVVGTKRARETTDEGTGGPSKKAKEQQNTEAAGDQSSSGEDEGDPTKGPVEWIVQSTTCLSKKIDGQIRCFQCIARAIGHGCCFLGVRSFGVDSKGNIITPPVFHNTKLQDDVPRFTKQLIAPINEQYNQLMRTWLAPQLLPIIERERDHAEGLFTKRARLDLNVHSMCDTCNSAILGSEWMCSTCGRVACRTCFQALRTLERQEDEGKGIQMTAVESQRRKKCIAKKRGERGIAGEGHHSSQFVPMTRLDKKDLAQLQADLYKWKITHAIVPSDGSAMKFLNTTYLTPSPLPDYDQGTHPVHHVPAKDMNAAVFLELWLSSAPVLVTDVNLGSLAKWTPSYIANRYPSIEIQLQNNKGTEVLSAKVPYFFGQFNEDGGPQRDETVKQTFRTKDFPTARQFKREFLELAAEFYRILPIRDLLHPDGPLNFLAHTPVNALQPDVGPRGTNSWAVDAATGTTLLRTDVTDIASLMYWGHHDEATGRELRIRWDVYRSEDIEGLRDYCWELLTKKVPKGTSAARFRETHDDPLLNPCIYLNQRQREHLATTKKIYSHAVYQYPGQLVLIPAGCPYQVSSWSDHLSLTTQFLAGPRLPHAVTLNDACRHETKERTLWRTDNIQLERQLLYAWYSCQNADRKYKPTPLNWKPRDSQTAEDMARAAAKDPKKRGEATKAFQKLPGEAEAQKEKETK